MSEFVDRIDAQRRILKLVNNKPWPKEQLFALNRVAIRRWASANQVVASTPLVEMLNGASGEIFIMANHSDDPIAGTYLISKGRLREIEGQLVKALSEREETRVSQMPQ